MTCNVFNTEYSAEYPTRKQNKVPIYIPFDCYAKTVDEGKEIDPRLAAAWTRSELENEELIKKLISDRLRSVYQVHYKNYFQPNKGAVKYSSENFEGDSELLKYSTKLYTDSYKEKVLAPPPTFKRVFGFANPKQLHSVLSTYQNTYGRTGARIMIKNAPLIAIRKRRQGY